MLRPEIRLVFIETPANPLYMSGLVFVKTQNRPRGLMHGRLRELFSADKNQT